MVDSSSQKTPLWLRVSLLASLALNVLVVAAVVGFLALGDHDRRSDRDRSDFGSFYTRALSDQDRRALRRDLISGLGQRGRDRDAFLDDMRRTLEVLRATPFDAEAFSNAMADQSSRRLQRETVGRQLLANRIAAMNDQERAAYADRIQEQLTDLSDRIRR